MLENYPWGPVGLDCGDYHPVNHMPLRWRVKRFAGLTLTYLALTAMAIVLWVGIIDILMWIF